MVIEKDCFACHHGDFAGNMFIVVGVDEHINCLLVPVMSNMKIPKDKFIFGIKEAILKLSLIHISEPTRPY